MPPSAPAIQVCQPGYDVRNCPDWAYLFNSDWPNLAIAYEQTIVSSGEQAVAHNLGFPPLTVGWFTYNNQSYGRVPGSDIDIDNTNAYVNVAGQITVRSYNIDISKEATYALPQSAQAKLPYNDQFGMKVAKNGRLITSSNLNDFILHTRTQSPAVLDVATQSGKYFLQSSATNYWPYGARQTFDLIVYPLQTSYIPWCMSALFIDGTWVLGSAQSIWYDSTTNSLVTNITASGIGSLIVLRDPLFYPNVIQVVY